MADLGGDLLEAVIRHCTPASGECKHHPAGAEHDTVLLGNTGSASALIEKGVWPW